MKGQVLITGGTGSFGTACTRILLANPDIERVIVFSRDELKQSEMRRAFPDPRFECFLGDVRDPARVRRAFEARPDLVIHAAALKQVQACEANPFEAVQTNVIGSMHVIDAAIECGIPKVIALSTDKAVAPINTYGKTKALAESLFVRGNTYAGKRRTRFSVVRYGNILWSRGSVVPIFLQARDSGVLNITDRRATRFWMPIEAAVQFVLDAADRMQGGEIFVPRIPSATVEAVARAIGPGCRIEVTGLTPGEKLHEALIAPEEMQHTRWDTNGYTILPAAPSWPFVDSMRRNGPHVSDTFAYTSDQNPQPVIFQEEAACASPL